MKKSSNKQTRRILARQLARPLTVEEMEIVAGGVMLSTASGASATTLRLADTWSCTGCPASDCDS